jgi:hypothetical protein
MNTDSESAEEAARFDRLLAAAPAPAVPAALERRILADFDRIASRWTFAKALRRAAEAVWPGAPAWQPAFAFAAALLIGTGVAGFAPFDIPQQDDAGAAVFALDVSPDGDAGQGI